MAKQTIKRETTNTKITFNNPFAKKSTPAKKATSSKKQSASLTCPYCGHKL